VISRVLIGAKYANCMQCDPMGAHARGIRSADESHVANHPNLSADEDWTTRKSMGG